MILLTPTHINLGLRPSGLYELVSRTDLSVSFVETSPGGEVLDLSPTLLDRPDFLTRGNQWFQDLRLQRLSMLQKPLKALRVKKPSIHKEKTHATKRRTSESSRQLEGNLAGLDPVTAALIRRLGGIS